MTRITFSFAARNVIRHYGRSILVLLTVASGVGGLFAFEGFNHGMMTDYRNRIVHQQTGNGQVTEKNYRENVYEKPSEHWLKDSERIREKLRQYPFVEDLYPRLRFAALLSSPSQSSNLSAFGEGVDGEKEAAFFTSLRFISGKQLTDESNGIILARKLAENLNAKVGDRITILSQNIRGALNGADATVVGIFVTGDANLDRTFFRIQLKQAQALLETDKVENLTVGLKDYSDWKKFEETIANDFPELQTYPFEEMDKAYYKTSKVWLENQFQLFLLIFLSVIFLGVFNTTSLGILERTQEIGILKANGESWANVKSLILTEAAILALLGAFVGVFTVCFSLFVFFKKGIYMPPPPGFEGYYYAQVQLTLLSAVKWTFVGVAASLVATLWAFRKISRKPVTELLQHV